MNTSRRSTFRLNRSEGKVLGVCAGIADHFEIDVTLVRVGMAVSILMTFPVVLIGYFVLAAVTKDERGERYDRSDRRERREHREHRDLDAAPRHSAVKAEETRQRLRDLDARMQALEAEVVTTNSTLAREIDALR